MVELLLVTCPREGSPLQPLWEVEGEEGEVAVIHRQMSAAVWASQHPSFPSLVSARPCVAYEENDSQRRVKILVLL